ncbi:MAG TPA: zinc ribbon domain-containing protein [Nevskiaceae bacterium]|nr:zinc ribbon domain-containing protein [Nevskiaceae bacterium]
MFVLEPGAGAALGEFRRQIEYKARWYGRKVVVADRWFASSQL